MLTGWQPRFPVGRRLNHPERSSELRHDIPSQFSPDDAFGLIAMNSQYIDFVDRSFKVKGMAATLSAIADGHLLYWRKREFVYPVL